MRCDSVRWPSVPVPIDSIKEIRTGKNTPIFRNKEFSGAYCEECAFSIIYGEEFDSLDLVAPCPDEANIWITGLNALIGESIAAHCTHKRDWARARVHLNGFIGS